MGTLTIQPSGKDTRILTGAPDTNYGTLTKFSVNPYSLNTNRSILQFSLAGIPAGQTITLAKLSLYYYVAVDVDPVGRTYWAYRLTRTDWVELEATWNIYKTGSNWTAAGGDYTTDDGASDIVPADFDWMDWNVLAQIQHAYAEAIEAAFLIRDGTEGVGNLQADFYSREYTDNTDLCPKLYIEYTPAVVAVGRSFGYIIG